MINQDRIVKSFISYVQIDSPTKHERAFAMHMKKEFEALGAQVVMDNAGEKVGSDSGNLWIRLEGSLDAEPILFSCHMDTVSPGRGIKPLIKDGTIYSDGTTILAADNKAGIAAIVEAIKVIKENNIPHPDIEIILSIYEEGGLHGIQNFDFSPVKSKRAFILDSGGDPGEIIIKGPAQDKIEVTIKGVPAHAGVCPEEGISAIMVAADAIHQMKLLRIDSETTANIGKIQGGEVTNIVTPEVTILAEARSLCNDKLSQQSHHMVACFENAANKFKAEAITKVSRMYSAFTVEEDHPIVKQAFKACEKVGVKPFLASSGGGSDTNIINEKGIPAINLGIGERKPHTLEEHIHIKDLVNVADIVLKLIQL